MEANRAGSAYTVKASEEDVAAFMGSWPCSGLEPDVAYVFEFSASNGDLLDVSILRDGKLVPHSESNDGPALAALSEDAGRYGAEELGLEDVLAVRFGHAPVP